MPMCVMCGKDTGLVGALTFNRQYSRCGKCDGTVKVNLNAFRSAFIAYCRDGILSPDEWSSLYAGVQRDRLDIHEALAFVRTDALNLLERTLAFVSTDGMITEAEATDIIRLQQALEIPDIMGKPILDRLRYLQGITEIRQGKLPTIRPSIHLESGEIAHMEVPAQYHKVNAKSITFVPGRLIATNKQLHFLSQGGGWVIKWKTLMRVDIQGPTIYLELSVKKGNGTYAVPDTTLAAAVLDTCAKIDRRELLTTTIDSASRHIPHDVKVAVWQRDGGKCVQCGATAYLEFDHIIPYSKGGANTVNNVQLLCRKCNLDKSDMI